MAVISGFQSIITGTSGGTNVFHFEPGSPALGVTTVVHAAITLPASGTTVVTTAITQPDVPRNVTITGNAAGIVGNVVVAGTNIDGSAMSETLAANATTTVVGNKAFATITSITVPAKTNGSGDTIAIGTGAKLGLTQRLTLGAVLVAFLGGVKEATAPTVATSASVLESNTVTLNSALNATAVDVFFLN